MKLKKEPNEYGLMIGFVNIAIGVIVNLSMWNNPYWVVVCGVAGLNFLVGVGLIFWSLLE